MADKLHFESTSESAFNASQRKEEVRRRQTPRGGLLTERERGRQRKGKGFIGRGMTLGEQNEGAGGGEGGREEGRF